MKLYLGRLIDHIQIVVQDLEISKYFYKEVLKPLGLYISREGAGFFSIDELFVTPANKTSKVSHIHLSFQAASAKHVEQFYYAGLAAGGKDNGKPGERVYHPGYYGAFLLDPDGNNIEATWHGSAQRSCSAIEVTPEFALGK